MRVRAIALLLLAGCAAPAAAPPPPPRAVEAPAPDDSLRGRSVEEQARIVESERWYEIQVEIEDWIRDNPT